MDYEELRKLAVAAARIPASVFSYSGVSNRYWLCIRTGHIYDVLNRQIN
jgi:hypothetical protein